MASQDEYQQHQFFKLSQEDMANKICRDFRINNKDVLKSMWEDDILGIPYEYRFNKKENGTVLIEKKDLYRIDS